MSAEWPEGGPNHVSLPTIVSSSDLFDGELFGDELIDIYNNEVTAGNGDSNELPSLPPMKGKTDVDQLHPGAEAEGDIDDGLGAFRPSTSFNDLTALLGDTGPTANSAEAPAAQPDPAASVNPKKRSAPLGNAPPPIKRRVSSSIAKDVNQAVKNEPGVLSKAAKPDNTPNPLGLPSKPSSANPKYTGDAKAQPCTATSNNFKSLAQAAVSNLILTAGAGTSKAEPAAKVTPTSADGKVDTSTAHIKALTGNNWVTACSGTTAGIVPVSTTADAKNANRARRQNLTPDERARQNRDRNREHARNTRLRKKAYVEELKRTLTELVAQRDASDLEKRQSAQREAEQREVRFRVIEEFLKLRGRNEANFARWAAILEDGFTLTLPATSFRSTVSTGNASNEQVLSGVPEVMADATNVANFFQALKGEQDGDVSLQYECERKNFFMDNCNAVVEWVAKTNSKSSSDQFTINGLIRGHFSPASNKLISANISFDTGVVQAHLAENGQHTSSQDAAEAVANQAGALLDSLQVPQISGAVPSAVTLVPPSSSESSESSGDKDDSLSSDGSVSDRHKPNEGGMTTRRVLRRSA